MPSFIKILASVFTLATTFSSAQKSRDLFDGQSLKGWQIDTATKNSWRVEHGILIGERKDATGPSFLWSEKTYEHFEFRALIKLSSSELNSGIHFRTQNRGETAKGYQADIGTPDRWCSIIEDSGKKRGVLAKANPKKVTSALKKDDWNEYRIRANGPRLQIWLNGQEMINFIETDPSIPYRGSLAIELPEGDSARVELKGMTLKQLDGGVDPNDSNAWWAAKARITYQELQVSNIPKSPQEELQTFKLPDGFVAELVAQESEGIGKFVAVDFDNQGRMWSMTALDYPVDAKKEKAKAQNLFKNGGKDKILVFDTPTASGVQTPRIFATDLAIPLGIMPYQNGAIAQYGPDIRHYQDSDGDGKADKHKVILTGFGIEDSHLFPHQFTRGPGGWMYLVQGLGNFSNVQRPDGSAFIDGTRSKPYNRCRIGRMTLDGSNFQYTTTGPNNVWGLVTGRDGEWFIQEANDKGYPVAPYDFGVFLKTGGTTKIKSYQPILPPIFETAIMGGTGLSGLTLAEDRNSPFTIEGKKTFYIANPLTSSIQIITGTPLGNNRYAWAKEDTFLSAGDRWFRPVGMKFGPDGALYVVDWYNKIIAHGEVSQNHPDRDKVRGRIWRIRHQDQKLITPPNLATANRAELLKHLRHDNALIARKTWLEIIDRKATELAPDLTQIVLSKTEPLDLRLSSLWALEGLAMADAKLLTALSQDPAANLRAEVVRISGRVSENAEFAAIAKAAAVDTAVRVRNALGEALVSRLNADANAMHAAALLGKAALNKGDHLTIYEREFERFLARWAMENNPAATAEMLGKEELLMMENRLLAMQSLKPGQAALAFLSMIPKLDRNLTTTELTLITSQLAQPEVNAGFKKLLGDPARQASMLEALSKATPSTSNQQLTLLLVDASRQLITRESSIANKTLVIQVAQRHRLHPLQSEIGTWLLNTSDSKIISAGLRCLRELGPVDSTLCLELLKQNNDEIQQEALIALSTAAGENTIASVALHWDLLSATGKQSAISGLINSTKKAEAFGKAVLSGTFGEIDNGSLEKIVLVLGDGPTAKELLKKLGDSIPMVIRLGAKGDSIHTNLILKGAFTIEGWIRLSGKGALNTTLFSSNNGALTFAKGRLNFSGQGRRARNLLVAKTTPAAGQWVHYAFTRDAKGILRFYLDGSENAQSKRPFKVDLTALNFGSTSKAGNTTLELMELRLWKIDLAEQAIRRGMPVSYASSKKPTALSHRFSGDLRNLPLTGEARITPSSSAPALITIAEAEEIAATFENYQAMISKPGNSKNGKLMFQGACAACHMVNNVGGNLGPDLSGAGTMGDVSLLRNILTPNAALETSYYRHDLKLKDGSLVSGFMASEDDKVITIRLIGADDRMILKSQIATHSISKRSLMPEGLINAMTDQQVIDLFEYLRTLK